MTLYLVQRYLLFTGNDVVFRICFDCEVSHKVLSMAYNWDEGMHRAYMAWHGKIQNRPAWYYVKFKHRAIHMPSNIQWITAKHVCIQGSSCSTNKETTIYSSSLNFAVYEVHTLFPLGSVLLSVCDHSWLYRWPLKMNFMFFVELAI